MVSFSSEIKTPKSFDRVQISKSKPGNVTATGFTIV